METTLVVMFFWLHCNGINENPSRRVNIIGRIQSREWSLELHTASCLKGDYLFGIQVHSEPSQGSASCQQTSPCDADDTSLNNVRLWCKSPYTGEEYQLAEPAAPMWGGWTSRVNCPKYYGISGVRLQIEEWREDNDDTSLGRIRTYCKPITTFNDVKIYNEL